MLVYRMPYLLSMPSLRAYLLSTVYARSAALGTRIRDRRGTMVDA